MNEAATLSHASPILLLEQQPLAELRADLVVSKGTALFTIVVRI